MSSQSGRRSNRNSVNGTPRSNRNSIDGTPRRRSTRGSEAPMSDAPLRGSDDRPASEVGTQAGAGAGSQQTTPRGNARSSQNTSQSQAPPTSSPLFFQSTPNGDSQSQSQSLGVPAAAVEVNGSSPLRQRSDAATPRPSGGFGGRSRHHPAQVYNDTIARLTYLRRILAYPLHDQFGPCRTEWA